MHSAVVTRRWFLASSGLALAAFTPAGLAAWSRPRSGPAAFFEVVPILRGELRPAGSPGPRSPLNVLVGEGGNTLVAADEGFCLVVDTKISPYGNVVASDAAACGARLRDAIPRLVINTHHHYDHTGGNHAFTGIDGFEVLSHGAARERVRGQLTAFTRGGEQALRALTGPGAPKSADAALPGVRAFIERAPSLRAEDFVPGRAMTGDREDILLGGLPIELRHFGAGHTDNDVVVRLPAYNVLHAGDLLFHNVWPYVDRPGGCTSEGWIKSLEKILELCDAETVVVPGHGPVTDRVAIRAQIAFFETMRERAKAAVKSGVTREEFLKTSPPEYADYAAGDRIRPITLGGLYDEAAGTPPAR